MSQQPPSHGMNGQPPAQKTNTLALVGMVLAIAGTVLIVLAAIFGLAALGGATLGFVALSQIRQSGEKGRGLAITAIIVGLFGTVVAAVLYVLLIAFGFIG